MKKILLVEDNDVNMRLVRLTLKNQDYEFIEANDGEEAIQKALNGKPDLIILDIQIPRMDGYEVARTLKSNAKTGDIPIIALTAHAMKGDEERVLNAGCDVYVSKPLDTTAFRNLVRSYLDRPAQAKLP
jgi:two-component system cell cycle response regulator DivK